MIRLSLTISFTSSSATKVAAPTCQDYREQIRAWKHQHGNAVFKENIIQVRVSESARASVINHVFIHHDRLDNNEKKNKNIYIYIYIDFSFD